MSATTYLVLWYFIPLCISHILLFVVWKNKQFAKIQQISNRREFILLAILSFMPVGNSIMSLAILLISLIYVLVLVIKQLLNKYTIKINWPKHLNT